MELNQKGIKMIRIVLPWPPSINRTYKVGNGRFYKDSAAKSYADLVCAEIIALRAPTFVQERLFVSIALVPPNKSPIDMDNRLKVMLDAMQTARPYNPGLYANDNQIRKLLVELMPPDPEKKGFACVVIRDYDVDAC